MYRESVIPGTRYLVHGTELYIFIFKVTSFTKKVYRAVLSIPLGEVRTYKWVAQKAGNPKAARAVGQILKKNPFPLIIPCHRVVASHGKLGGYAWGRQKKQEFLNLERQIKELML